jgi:hypothetical protein
LVLLSLGQGPSPALAQDDTAAEALVPPPAGRAVPFGPGEAILLRSTLIAFNQANATGDYSVVVALAAPEFAAAHPDRSMASLFRPWRDKARDFGFAAITDPALDEPPLIDENGVLRLVGSLPTPNFKLEFNFTYKKVGNRWALAGFALGDGALRIASDSAAADHAATASAERTAVPPADAASLVGIPAAAAPAPLRLPPLPRIRPTS